MESKEKDNLIFIHLYPGEEINKKIKEICVKHNVKTAVLLSGIGQIKKVKIGYYKKKADYSMTTFKKPLEIISLTGNICKQKKDFLLHLHICLGDKNKNVYGGHFVEGFISVTGEIIILKTDVIINRKINDETGLQTLNLE